MNQIIDEEDFEGGAHHSENREEEEDVNPP